MSKEIAFQSIIQQSSDLLNEWTKIYHRLESVEAQDGNKFNINAPIPSLDLSIEHINKQINLIVGQIQSFENYKVDELLTIPTMARQNIDLLINKIKNPIAEIKETLNRQLNSLNPETFQGSSINPQRPNNPESANFSDRLLAIGRSLDELFIRVIQIRISLPKSTKRNSFPGIVKDFNSLTSDIRVKHKEISTLIDEVRSQNKTTKIDAKNIEELRVKIEDARVEIFETKDFASESSDIIEQSLAKIEASLKKNDELIKSVESYRTDFEALQSSINDKKESLKKGTDEQIRLTEKLSEIEKDILNKNEQASSMLANATVAGLAASFGTTRTKLNDELWWSRLVFYISIFVLIVLAIPMLLYIFPFLPQGGPTIDRNTATFGAIVGEVVARAAILLPGIWFVSFSSKRHSSLFRLREHYEYKYNMAVSVEGFKQQAPDVASAIAGTTFYELLTKNPADVMEGGKESKDGRVPNPLLEAILDFLNKKKSK